MSAAAAVALPSCGFRFHNSSSSTFTKSKYGMSHFPQKEITDWTPLFARPVLQSTVWSIRCEGNNRGERPRRNAPSGRTNKEDENPKGLHSFGNESSNSSNQEEIIALFRRIQSSITKEGPRATRKRNSDDSKAKQSAESVLDVLRQSRKQIDEKKKVFTRKRGLRKKEQTIEDNPPALDFKPARPPSNFVKKSPIPTLSITEKDDEVTAVGMPPAAIEELELLEVMKLPELKEFAKSKGVKGYSRLKKRELVELLKGALRS